MSTVPIAQGLVECRVMQHTPGPWRVERQNPSPTTGEWMISGAKPGYLAEVRDCGSGDVAANAKLIAAAPDLLAAIEAMRVAGGAAEFQAAFDKAKKLAMVHNAVLGTAQPKERNVAVKVKDLAKILQKKDQNAEVEFIVVTTSGELVCMDVQAKAGDMVKVLKLFNGA